MPRPSYRNASVDGLIKDCIEIYAREIHFIKKCIKDNDMLGPTQAKKLNDYTKSLVSLKKIMAQDETNKVSDKELQELFKEAQEKLAKSDGKIKG